MDDKLQTDPLANKPLIAKRSELAAPQRPGLAGKQEIELANQTLKEGKRSIKRAVAWEIRNPATGQDHHLALKLETHRFQAKGNSWLLDEKKSITLDSDDQISRLVAFLSSLSEARSGKVRGKVLLTPVRSEQNAVQIRRALDLLTTSDRAKLLLDLLETIRGDSNTLKSLTDAARASPDGLRAAVAAINIGRFESTLAKLTGLIEQNAGEGAFQRLLTDNPWLFGAEYSKRDSRRWFTRDQQQDFMLRRTVDDCLELIEIKTPLNDKPLFLPDRSHRGSMIPRQELTAVLAQVMRDLEALDENVLGIQARDGEDVRKIRARIIIGRDGNKEQVVALRRLNGHLHRVEVMTFDMLLRIGQRVLDAIGTGRSDRTSDDNQVSPSTGHPQVPDEDIPF